MWTENADWTNLECRIWPRAGAAAAALWSGEAYKRAKSNSLMDGINTNINTHTNISISSSAMLVASYVHFAAVIQAAGVKGASVALHSVNEIQRRRRRRNLRPRSNFIDTQDGTGMDTSQYLYQYESGGREMDTIMTLKTVMQHFTGPILRADDKANQNVSLHISSQCPTIPSTLKRPLRSGMFKGAGFNVGNGGWDAWTDEAADHGTLHGDIKGEDNNIDNVNSVNISLNERESSLEQWLYTKAQAGFSLVGLCEMNHWNHIKKQKPVSQPDLTSAYISRDNRPQLAPQENFPMLRSMAARTGFPYSFIHASTGNPYHIALLSEEAFEIKGRWDPSTNPAFQRGALWAYITSRKLHVFVVHLHAHSSTARLEEARTIYNITNTLIADGERVVVMGDFNTLTPLDAQVHKEQALSKLLSQAGQPFTRLKKKFCKNHAGEPNLINLQREAPCELDYDPMRMLLDSGLIDSCYEGCLEHALNDSSSSGSSINTNEFLWSSVPKSVDANNESTSEIDKLNECMQTYCAGSEPTQLVFPGEWTPKTQSNGNNISRPPKLRLDFLLVSPTVIQKAKWHYRKKRASREIERTGAEEDKSRDMDRDEQIKVEGYIEMDIYTDTLSDHYPTAVTWIEDEVGVDEEETK